MKLMRPRHLLFAALFLLPTALHAQRDTVPLAELEPGERIRVYAPQVSRERITGQLVRVDADTLVLVRRGEPVRVPLSGVWSAQVSGGRHRLLGGVAGTAVGMVGGTLIGGNLGRRGKYADIRSDNAAFGALVGGGIGAVVGLVAGATRGIEFWDDVSVRPQADPGGGAGLSFSIPAP